MLEAVGQELKRVREARGLTIQKVADETRVSPKHLLALESNNFHHFPGETYTLGFLRNYSIYLGLDENRIIQKYKSNQMMQTQTPIKELTQNSLDVWSYLTHYSKFVIPPVILVALLFFGFQYFFSGKKQIIQNSNTASPSGSPPGFNIRDYLKNSGEVPEEKTESVHFANGILISLIGRNKGVDFLLDGVETYIVLKGLDYKKPEKGRSKAELVFYPGKRSVYLTESTPFDINFPWLASKLRMHLLGTTPNNIKLKVEKLGKNSSFDERSFSDKTSLVQESTSKEIINPENFAITLVAKIIGENYVEFYIDGKQKKRGLMSAGEVLRFEANDSIQMKIGDAGAIDVTINGDRLKSGKKGQQVNKIIRKVKDPLEQFKYRLQIKDT